MSKLYGFAAVVLLISIAIYGTLQWRDSQVIDDDGGSSELAPDFTASQLNSDIYSELGTLSHKISAKTMEHYASTNVTKFTQPFYTLYPKNSTPPWNVSADKATLYNNSRVVLNNRVVLKATENNSLIQEIHCKYLELDLKTNIISSDQTILILGKNFTMYGSGLIIDLNTTQMTLTEHVQTIYQKDPS